MASAWTSPQSAFDSSRMSQEPGCGICMWYKAPAACLESNAPLCGRKHNKHSLSDRKGFAAMHNHQDITSGEKNLLQILLLWESNHYNQSGKATLKLISIPHFFQRRAPHICRQVCTCPLDILSPRRFQPDLPGLLWATWHVIAATHIWQRHF